MVAGLDYAPAIFALRVNNTVVYAFGYGSLLDPGSFSATLGRSEWTVADYPLATLRDHRRVWNVAMDNAQCLSGYKRYFTPGTDTAPDVLVTFLNIETAPDASVVGVLAKLTRLEFEALRRRERNYEHVDVGAAIEKPPADGPVYAFVGSAVARERFAASSPVKPAVVRQGYVDLIERAVRGRGQLAWDNYAPAHAQALRMRRRMLDMRRVP